MYPILIPYGKQKCQEVLIGSHSREHKNHNDSQESWTGLFTIPFFGATCLFCSTWLHLNASIRVNYSTNLGIPETDPSVLGGVFPDPKRRFGHFELYWTCRTEIICWFKDITYLVLAGGFNPSKKY